MLNLGRTAVADNGKAYVLEVEYIAFCIMVIFTVQGCIFKDEISNRNPAV